MEHTLKLRKGAWTSQEDDRLRTCIGIYGEGQWHRIPLRAGLNRCRKSCRLRWLNYLKPNIKRGEFAADEVDLIIRLHKLLGNRWSLIAGRLPGRTANDIKNYWNTHLKKKHSSPSKKEPNTPKKTRHVIFKPQPRNLYNKFFSGSNHQNSSQDIVSIPECDNIGERRMSLWWETLVPNSGEDQGVKQLSNNGENVEDKSLSTDLFVDDFNIWDLLDSPLYYC